MRLSIKWSLLAGWAIALSYLFSKFLLPKQSGLSLFEPGALTWAALVLLWIFWVGRQNACVQKKLECSLAEAKQQAESLSAEMENFSCDLPLPLTWMEEDGRLSRVNRSFERLLGYPASDLVFHNIAEFFADMPLGLETIKRLSAGEVLKDLEVRLKCKDGLERDILLDASFASSRTDLRCCSWRDVTDRHNSSLARQEAQELFSHLAAYLNCFVWVSSLDFSRMHYVSQTYTELFGRSCESLYNRPDSLLDALHPDDRARVFTALLRMQLSGCIDEEFRIDRGSGTIRWMHAQGFPVRDSQGGIRKICGFILDVTDRVHAQQLSDAQQTITAILDDAITVHAATYSVLQILAETADWQLGAIWQVDESSNLLRCVCAFEDQSVASPDQPPRLSPEMVLISGRGLPGIAWDESEPIWIPDILTDSRFPGSGHARLDDMKGALAYPVIVNGRVNGVIELYRRKIIPVDPGFLALLDVVGSQIAHFLELKTKENSALTSELKLRLSMESLTEHAVVMLNPMGMITEWSAGAEQLIGYERHEIVGRHFSCLYPDNDSQSHLAALKLAETTGRSEAGGWIQRKNGSRLWAMTATMAMRDECGLLCGFSHQVSEQRKDSWTTAATAAATAATAATATTATSAALAVTPQLVLPGSKSKKSKSRR